MFFYLGGGGGISTPHFFGTLRQPFIKTKTNVELRRRREGGGGGERFSCVCWPDDEAKSWIAEGSEGNC